MTPLFEATGSKLAPSMVTIVLIGPLAGVMLVMATAGITSKSLTLVPVLPLTVTDSLPVVAPLGTVTCKEVLLAETTEATAPLKLTISAAAFELNPVPVIVTVSPAWPVTGVKLWMVGVGFVIVNDPVVVAY